MSSEDSMRFSQQTCRKIGNDSEARCRSFCLSRFGNYLFLQRFKLIEDFRLSFRSYVILKKQYSTESKPLELTSAVSSEWFRCQKNWCVTPQWWVIIKRMSIAFQFPCILDPNIRPFCMRLVAFSSCQNAEVLYQLPRLEHFVIAIQNSLTHGLSEVKINDLDSL